FDQTGGKPHSRQVVTDKHRCAARVGIVVRLCTDAGNPDQGLELLFELVMSRGEISLDSLKHHDLLPLAYQCDCWCESLERTPSGGAACRRRQNRVESDRIGEIIPALAPGGRCSVIGGFRLFARQYISASACGRWSTQASNSVGWNRPVDFQ